MAGFKKFRYLVTYYTRDEIDRHPPTRRETASFTVEASSATRAITAFKKTPESKDAVIVAAVPDDENGRYDIGSVGIVGDLHPEIVS